MKERTIKGLAKVVNYNKPFFAEDLELNGGIISAMSYNQWIDETGKTKEIMVNMYNDIYKKCEVKEWIVNINKVKKYLKDLYKQRDAIQSAIDEIEKII